MVLLLGNGFSPLWIARYLLSISAVLAFSLILRELCPLQPCALITPFSLSMYWRVVLASSQPSKPVSFRIVKIVANLGVEAEIILSMFAVVGMSGIFLSHL